MTAKANNRRESDGIWTLVIATSGNRLQRGLDDFAYKYIEGREGKMVRSPQDVVLSHR